MKLKFNPKNQKLSNYNFLKFVADNYDELFKAYESGFYNPETGEKSVEAFNKWFNDAERISIYDDLKSSMVLENPILNEKRMHDLEIKTYPIRAYYADGTSEIKQFNLTFKDSLYYHNNEYRIDLDTWETFTYIWPDHFKESDNVELNNDVLNDIVKLVKRFGQFKYCINGLNNTIVFIEFNDNYKSDSLSVMQAVSKFNKEHSYKPNIIIKDINEL